MSSSNLNDIASALEKLNISDAQIATIKSYLTDVIGYDQIQNGLGQLVSVLATARNQDKEKVSELQNSFNNLKFVYGSYVGNGQKSFTINYGETGNFVIGFITAPRGGYNEGYQDNAGGIILGGNVSLWNYGYFISSVATVNDSSVTIQDCSYYIGGDYYMTNDSGGRSYYLMILN